MFRSYVSFSRVAALAAALSIALPAQYQSSSGMYFQSAGAAYMNTLSWSSMSRSPEMQQAMNDAEARANGQSGTSGSTRAASANSSTPALAASDFRPVPEERGKVLDSLVASVPAGPGRDKWRASIETLSAVVENNAGRKHNLAEATYLLIGVSLQTSTGRLIEKARAQELIRAIAAAYAGDKSFQRLDDRQRSRMYYLYTATIALTGGLNASKDPAEVQAAKALAQNTLREMGIRR